MKIIVEGGSGYRDCPIDRPDGNTIIHLYEPHPFNFTNTLEKATRIYGKSVGEHLIIHNEALMDYTGTVKLHVRPGRDGHTIDPMFEDTIEVLEVKCKDIAEIVDELGHIDLFRLDIEGAEIPVLLRLLDTGKIKQVGELVIEWHKKLSSYKEKAEDIKNRLRAEKKTWKEIT